MLHDIAIHKSSVDIDYLQAYVKNVVIICTSEQLDL